MMNFLLSQDKYQKYNVLVIGGDFNAHLGQDNDHKFAYLQ